MESQLGEMTQQAKVLSPKPDYLNSIPRPHMVERESYLLKVVLRL